jgi:hypothetical protein
MPSDLTNNSAQTARLIAIAGGTPYTTAGSLTATDIVDYYRFSTSTSSNLSVSLTGLTGNANLKVYKRDAAGALGVQLAPTLVPGTAATATVNTGTLSEAFVLNALTAGEYIIQVEPGAVGGVADYNLSALASIDGKDTTVLWRPEGSPANFFFKQSGAAYTERLEVDPVLAGYRIEATGDFDGDKVTDILWRQVGGASQEQSIWLMNADNTVKQKSQLRYSAADPINALSGLPAGSPWKTPTEIAVIGAKDIDGDGKDDLIWRNTTASKSYIYFWKMDGVTNLFDKAFIVDFLVGQTVVGFGDFNGDGKQDVVYRANAAGPDGKNTIGIWLMEGVNPGGTIQVGSIAATGKLAGIKNVNATVGGSANNPGADRYDDFVWFDSATGQASTWLMEGTPYNPTTGSTVNIKLAANLGSPLPGGFFAAGLADVTGDGNADILFRNEAGANLSVFALEGANVKASQVVSTVQGPQWYIAGLADFNNDGAVDILWRNRNQNPAIDPVYDAVTVWTMGGGVNGTGIKTQEWVMGTAGIPAPAFTPAGIRHIGPAFTPYLLSSQYVKLDQAIGGSTEAKSFDIGVVDGTANYQDFVLGAGTDNYKFKLVRSTKFDAFQLTAGVAGPALTTASLEVFQEGLAGVRTLVPTPAVGGVLAAGVYYIRIKNTGTPTPVTKTNYNLNISGTPIVVNLQTTPLTITNAAGTAGVTLVQVDPAFTAATPIESRTDRTTARVQYTVKNTEAGGNSGPFKVKFYLSRNATIDPTLVTGDFLLKEITVAAGVSGNGDLALTEDVLLPPGDNLFWTTDTDYYIGAIVDSENVLLETNETDNSNLGIGKDVNVVAITNTQTPDLLLASITGPGSATRGGTVAISYTAKNAGKRATAAVANSVDVAFYLFADDAAVPQFNKSGALTTKLTFEDTILGVPALGTAGPNAATVTLPGATDSFWSRPGIVPGTTKFYLAAVIDPAGAIKESDEFNNSNLGLGIDIISLGAIA